MKEYRYGNFITGFGYLLVAGVLVGAHFSIKAALGSSTSTSTFLFASLALLCVGAAIFLIREIKITRFGIGIDRVYLISVRYNRTLYFDQISGWREVDEEFHILPNDKSLKKIRVTTYLKDSSEIRDFLTERFPNVDEVEADTEYQQIIQNEEFGITPEDRMKRLERARRAARYTEGVGWAVAMWFIFYPHPYTLSLIAAMAYPFLAVAICFLYRGLIKSDSRKNSQHPSVIITMIVVPIGLMYRAIVDINTLSYHNGWILMILVTAVLVVAYQIPTDGFSFRKKADALSFVVAAILFLAYGFGSVTLTNAIADSSQPVVYPTVITNKRISSGKSTTYYLELKKWGDQTGDEEITVSRSEYESFDVGDKVNVHLRPGIWKMPWIELK